MMRTLIVAAGALATLSLTGSAAAFCRTTTCDPTDPLNGCRIEQGCYVGGLPLVWRSGCVSFGVQEEGSPKRGVSYDLARAIISDAFAQWQSVDCGNGKMPSLAIYANNAPIECNVPEYNQEAGNANVWMFRDDEWPYEGVETTLALTTVRYNARDGEIFDADVEINSYNNALSTPGRNGGADLDAIVTHEAGHFLGLSHSPVAEATMFATYTPHGSSLSTLHEDDAAGICDAYPPDDNYTCSSHTPRHGFAVECGEDQGSNCGVARVPGSSSGGLAAVAALLGALLLQRRRSRSPG